MGNCLPNKTWIEGEEGEQIPVEEIRVGDVVRGGKVLATVKLSRPDGHKFYEHFIDGTIVTMSLGHPHFGNAENYKISRNDSPHTYDILTEKGFYYVNGVKLKSTIKKVGG